MHELWGCTYLHVAKARTRTVLHELHSQATRRLFEIRTASGCTPGSLVRFFGPEVRPIESWPYNGPAAVTFLNVTV